MRTTLSLPYGGSPWQRPPDRDPPDRDPQQRDPRQRPPGHVTCDACWDRDPPPPWTESQTGVKTLPCPKLCLRAVNICVCMCACRDNQSKSFDIDLRMFVYFSDPYVKIVLFRGDRDIGQIDTAQTKRLKKVQTYILLCFFFQAS